MADSFGLKIGIEGEREFRESLREINQNFKVLASEMTLVSSEFDKQDQSIQAVTARNGVLNKEIDTQKDKISTLEKALANATASFGENDKRTAAWTIQLNNAKAGLNEMERELANNNKTLSEAASGISDAEKAEIEFSNAIKSLDANFKMLGSEMALVSSRFEKHDKSVQALSERNNVLNNQIDTQREKIANMEKALANSAAAFGESDKRTQAWAEKLNNAKAELNGMERELSNNEKSIRDAARGYDDAGKKLDEYGRAVEDAADKTSIFAEVLKANLAADAIKAGLGAIINLVKDVGAAVNDYINDGSAMAKEAAESHAKLEQVMRNTMHASDAEIESIMELARAQEQLGVVSARTQINGAQELGTYLEKSDSLQTLIPVMNDMIVQQYGINSSQENAVNIATMLGKVMNGQVGALSRYGYTFDEVQENILKYGTEAERAAVLAEVVGESVGGMNEALAATDLGKMSSLETILDNTKIKVGEVANDFQAQILGRMLPSVDALSGAFVNLLNGEGSVEDLAATFACIFDEIEGIINDIIPEILELGVQVLTAFITGIVDNLDTITDAVLALLQNLTDAISDLLPIVIEAGISLIFALIDGILQALPTLIGAALEAVVTLANGIAAALPELIPVIIETILFIVENLLNNLDAILDAALNIIMGLADGLIAALPVLIEALPQIIESIINFIVNSLPKIIEMGIELVIKLAFGLIQAIPQLLMAIPQIIGALIQGIIDLFPKIIESGQNIVKSIWNGIVGMGQWLADNFFNMIAGIVNSIVGAVNRVLSLIGVQLPTMQVRTSVEASPVAVNDDAVRRAQNVIVRAAEETVRASNSANEAILASAYEAAEERIALEGKTSSAAKSAAKEREKAAKDAMNEELNFLKWRRDMGEITTAEYYTELEMFRDKYFAEDTEEWRKYTLELKKLRDAMTKEEEKALNDLLKEHERVAKEKEKIAKENADAINRLGNDLTKALKEHYSEQKNAFMQALNDEVAAVRSASYDKIAIYDQEYAEKMRLLDEEGRNRLSALQGEIDAIDEKSRAEDRARRERDYNEKLADLRTKFAQANSAEEQTRIQREVNRLVESRQIEITREQREAEKARLREQMRFEEQQLKEAQEALQQSKLNELEMQKDALNQQFNELMSAESLRTEALKLMLSGQQDDILALLDTYTPGWRDAGKSFADMLAHGIADGRANIEASLADTLSHAVAANGINALGNAGNPQMASAGTFAGLEQSKADSELKLILNFIHDSITQVIKLLDTLTQEIASLCLGVKTQIEEFVSFSLEVGKLAVAIENIKFTAVSDMQGSLGSMTNNFYFDNITVRSHSDMELIADFTFRKIQQALINRGVRI